MPTRFRDLIDNGLPVLVTGRGSEVSDHLIAIEPAFNASSEPQLRPAPIDDGRLPNRMSRLLPSRRTKERATTTVARSSIAVEAPMIVQEALDLCFLRVHLPMDGKLPPLQIEQLIGSLISSADFVSFEVIGGESELMFQFATAACNREAVFAQLRTHLPGYEIRVGSDAIREALTATGSRQVIPFGLAHHWFRPIPFGRELAADPLVPLVGAIESVGRGEMVCVQVMFCRTRHPWQRSARQQLFDGEGKSRYPELAESIKEVRQKLSAQLVAASIRVMTAAVDQQTSLELTRRVMSYFKQFGSEGGNSLVPLRPTPGVDEVDNVLRRTSKRSGCLLSVPEMGSMVRFPGDSISSLKVKRLFRREKRAPEMAAGDGIVLGRNPYQNEEREVRLTKQQRTRQMHVIGSSGSGKTTLLLSLIKADLERREDSVCVVDVHGDLINSVMENVPDDRLRDVMLFDASDADRPVGFNVLHASSPLEKTILSSDLVATFRRMATSWGDIMDTTLANAILAFLESTRGGTLADLRRFLVEPDFRREFLLTVTDEAVRYFWEHEFQLIVGKPQGSILVRLDSLLRQSLVRNIVCQRDNQLDFRTLVNDKKIILVKLSHGLIGEENAYLLGTMILSRIYQAALSRQDSDDRPYCWTYIDEFHHLISPSLESVLSGSRKYNLGLTLAHQEFRQLQSRSQEVASSVLANCYTRVCFRLGDTDAERFAGGFSSFDARALQNLGIGEAIARIERADFDFNLRVEATPPVDPVVAAARIEAIRKFSRETYGRARAEVERELAATRAHVTASKETPSRGSTARSEMIELSNYGEPGFDRASATKTSGEHAYLQRLIKRIGERYGYRSTLEQPVLGGAGKVDVALESADLRIAVEIANTNTAEYEVDNIQKCLAAQFDRVVVVSTDAVHLGKIRSMAQATLSDAHLLKTSFLEPANIHSLLERLHAQEQPASTSQKVKGYRVDASYAEVSDADAELIAKNVTDLLLERGER